MQHFLASSAYRCRIVRENIGAVRNMEGRPRFPLGRIGITGKARALLTFSDALHGLRSHASGDWGLLTEEDWWDNEVSLTEGHQVTSVHLSSTGKRFWIVTAADRSSTTIMLPSDNLSSVQ